jgi:hypothetical protein
MLEATGRPRVDTIANGAQRRQGQWPLVVCLGVAALAGTPSPASAQAESEPLLSTVRLLNLAGGPGEASGVAITRFFGFTDGTSEEDLRVEVRHLSAHASYELFVDDARTAALVTDAEGAAAVLLADPVVPGAQAVPAPLFPVNGIDSIVIRDAAGVVVLCGDFANALQRQRVLPDDGRLSD